MVCQDYNRMLKTTTEAKERQRDALLLEEKEVDAKLRLLQA